MWKTVLRRVLIMIPQLFVLSIIVFVLAKMMPGDPFSGIAENPKISQEVIEQMRIKSGFYDPVYIQYFKWLKNFISGDFGMSYVTGKSVATMMGERIFNTLNLALFATILQYLIAIPVGMLAGRYNNSKFDRGVVFFNFFTYAIPSFVFYLFMILIFGYKLKLLPTSGSVDISMVEGTFAYYVDKFKHLILPGTCMAILGTTGTIQYLRNEVIDSKQSDYVRTARAKGVPISKVYSKHIFRNSILPIAAFFGFTITGLFGGAVFAETIFGYPGMGKLFVSSILDRDYSVITTLMMFYGSLTLLGSLLSDIIMMIVDPRIKID